MQIGSRYLGNGHCQFTVWSPLSQQIDLHLVSPEDKLLPLQRSEQGYWQTTIAAAPGTLYFYRINGEVDRPDPASQSQPQGVHGPSEVIDQSQFTWTDESWSGIPLDDWVLYELHVGTFTPEGTFDAMIGRIPELLELGVNAIEIMPVAQFPGDRNWGYDGVYPFGVQQSYGGVAGLKRLVNACHQQGMAVVLDVVYNHMGPEGNYFSQFAPYFTDRYKTPWGSALNFDDAYSDGVRNYFLENLRYWLQDYHLDGLRLDAIHAIYDFGARHILQEMADLTNQLAIETGRKLHLIAESDLNDPRIIRSPDAGGYGIHAQWCDDFHHSLRTILTRESHGYYADYGDLEHLATAYRDSFVYAWTYSASRKRFHGNPAIDCPTTQFVICAQNHDQVGNRMLGDRLTEVVSFESQKLAAAAVLLSPCLPMLFMGEEYGEEAPFQYFVSHGDPDLVAAVRKGRKEEFAAFHAEGEAPDPQSVETFQRSKLNWEQRHTGKHQTLWQFHQTLIRMRQQIPALAHKDRNSLEAKVIGTDQVLMLRRWYQDHEVVCLFNFHAKPVDFDLTLSHGTWKKLLDSSDAIWGGSGSAIAEILTLDSTQSDPARSQTLSLNPESVVVYSR